jgi:hypothetical protein
MNKLESIERHAADLEKAAVSMIAAGIGGDPERGHALALRTLAADLRAQAALGRQPTTFELINGAADVGETRKAPAAFNRPLTLVEAVNAAADDQTRLQALVNLRARAERAGYSIPDDQVIRLPDLDAALDKSGTRTQDRFALKADLFRAGLLR